MEQAANDDTALKEQHQAQQQQHRRNEDENCHDEQVNVAVNVRNDQKRFNQTTTTTTSTDTNDHCENDDNDTTALDRTWQKQEADIMYTMQQRGDIANRCHSKRPGDDTNTTNNQSDEPHQHTTSTTTKVNNNNTTTTTVDTTATNPRRSINHNNNNISDNALTPLQPNQQQQQQDDPQETERPIAPPPPPKVIKLIKSTRLKGYMTLTLAALINLDAARTSTNIDSNAITIVPSTDNQRIYAQVTAIISLLGTTIACLIHFDRITPLQANCWIPLFQNGSIYEGCFILFTTIWWSIATGFATSVNGIAGDGKGQYSLYYSTWACCLTSYWILERWCVAAGWSSFNSFIASWPNRSPAWICIMILSFFTLVWYLDLWQNHTKLHRESEQFIIEHFQGVGGGQWKWLMAVSVCTFCPAVFFVAVELFRETKADGSIAVKSNLEALIEGIWFVGLTFAWIATVMIATTPRGAASLIGNSYFFTWVMSIFVFEGFVWYIHDRRKATYQALKEKQNEYRQRQELVLQQAREIQRKYEERLDSAVTPMDQDSETMVRGGYQPSSRGFSYEYADTFNNNNNQIHASRRRF